jgi:hypothetical protein
VRDDPGGRGTETTLVRTRIIAVAVSASVLAIVLFGVPLAVAVLQYAMQVERSELERTARSVAITVAPDVFDEVQIANIDAPGSVRVTVYDADGDRLGGPGPPGDAKSVPYLRRGKPEARTALHNLDDYDIVATYGAEYRGVVQYANFEHDRLT